MKFRPILFSTPMVQAKLENRKNQTRRTKGLEEINENPDEWVCEKLEHEPAFLFFNKEKEDYMVEIKCPYGNVGDVLWVRESWQEVLFKDEPTKYLYKANPMHDAMKWKPSIHMPKAACRLFLRVKNVRVERLQDISESDAIAEGIEKVFWGPDSHFIGYFDYIEKCEISGFKYPKDSFKSLWDSINADKMPWSKNPWVWVVEFEPIDQPIEFNMPF